jgi:ketosteroid isomerase-like protein
MKLFKRGLIEVVSGALLGFTLIGVTTAAATGNTPSDSEQLIANERAWAKASLDGDADRMASYMAEEYVELAWEPGTKTAPAHWSSTGKKEWVESVRHRTEVYTSIDVRNLTVHLQGTLAVVTGEYSQTGTDNGKDISAKGIYADTWLKQNGRWLVIHSVFP